MIIKCCVTGGSLLVTWQKYGSGDGRCLYLSAGVRRCLFLSGNVCGCLFLWWFEAGIKKKFPDASWI